MTLYLKYTKTDSIVKEPDRISKNNVSYRLYALNETLVLPNEMVKVETGIIFEMPGAYFAQVYSNIECLLKKNLLVRAGVIDSGYRGSIKVVLINVSKKLQIIFAGECIAEINFESFLLPNLIYKEDDHSEEDYSI